MTREEAIDWLARLKSNTVNHTLDMPLWWNEPLAEALDMAIKALEQEPRWIPVSERLPNESLNSVIGWDAYREKCVFVQYINGAFQITGKAESFNIVAWMPLPEPYEPQERGDKVNCNKTECYNCVNHNYCDYESDKESEE